MAAFYQPPATYIPTYLHSYIPTQLHPYIPTYVHTYIPRSPLFVSRCCIDWERKKQAALMLKKPQHSFLPFAFPAFLSSSRLRLLTWWWWPVMSSPSRRRYVSQENHYECTLNIFECLKDVEQQVGFCHFWFRLDGFDGHPWTMNMMLPRNSMHAGREPGNDCLGAREAQGCIGMWDQDPGQKYLRELCLNGGSWMAILTLHFSLS